MKVCALLTSRVTPPARVERHIGHMGHDITQHAVAGDLVVEAPGEQSLRIAAVHAEEAPAILRQIAKRALADQLLGLDDQWRPAIIEADKAEDASFARDRFDLSGLIWPSPHRLLAEDMFAGSRSRYGNLDVQMIGRGDVYDCYLGIFNDIPPARGGALENPAYRGRSRLAGRHCRSK